MENSKFKVGDRVVYIFNKSKYVGTIINIKFNYMHIIEVLWDLFPEETKDHFYHPKELELFEIYNSPLYKVLHDS